MGTLRHIIIYLALAGAACYFFVVPFAIGVWRGHRGTPSVPDPVADAAAPLRSLRWITGLYGRFFVLYLVGVAISATYGYLGGDEPGEVCVNTNITLYGSAGLSATARPGGSVSSSGYVQACALHPGPLQWVLFLLTKLPSLALWAAVLLLTLRLVRQAATTGPFTMQAAATMRMLGWVVVVGSMIVGALHALGSDLLTNMLVALQDIYDAPTIALDVVFAPLKALLPVPALVGAALLTFSYIIKVGAVMDEEIKATV
jgi:hypothetical protein